MVWLVLLIGKEQNGPLLFMWSINNSQKLRQDFIGVSSVIISTFSSHIRQYRKLALYSGTPLNGYPSTNIGFQYNGICYRGFHFIPQNVISH